MYKLFKVSVPECELLDLTSRAIFNDFTEIRSARMWRMWVVWQRVHTAVLPTRIRRRISLVMEC